MSQRSSRCLAFDCWRPLEMVACPKCLSPFYWSACRQGLSCDDEKLFNMEMAPKTQLSRLDDFLLSLETVSWFSNIGEPIMGSPDVPRIQTWAEWPGPDDVGVQELARSQQELYDEIANGGELSESLKRTWDHVHSSVLSRASSTIPFDPTKDAWHPPSSAVWQAAWTAGLIGLCLDCGRPVPKHLKEQWDWFLRGHWPCMYGSVSGDGRLGNLVVY